MPRKKKEGNKRESFVKKKDLEKEIVKVTKGQGNICILREGNTVTIDTLNWIHKIYIKDEK